MILIRPPGRSLKLIELSSINKLGHFRFPSAGSNIELTRDDLY